MKLLVLGGGVWGTAMGSLLSLKGYDITIWGHNRDKMDNINRNRVHPNLKDFLLSKNIIFTNSIDSKIEYDFIIIALPVQKIREVLEKLQLTKKAIYIILSKGIEFSTLKRVSEILVDLNISKDNISTLYGPTHSKNIMLKEPSMMTATSLNVDSANRVKKLFETSYVKININSDVVGEELSAALKNCMAIAVGIVDGMKYGYNTKAAIISEASREIVNIIKHFNGKVDSFFNPSGIGDLIATSLTGRNVRVGKMLGEGKSLKYILENSQISEGVYTIKAIKNICKNEGIESKLINLIYFIVHEGAKADIILDMFKDK